MSAWGKLKAKYNSQIRMPRKDGNAVISYLNQKIDCIEQPIEVAGEFFLHAMQCNVISSVHNRGNYDKQDLIFKYFIVEKNQKSSQYYSDIEPDMSEVFVLVEMCTGYIYSNCSRLFLYLAIEQGINADDLELCNDVCKSYLSHLERYMDLNKIC